MHILLFGKIGILAEQAKLPEWLMMGLYLLLFVVYSLCLTHAWRLGRWVKNKRVGNCEIG